MRTFVASIFLFVTAVLPPALASSPETLVQRLKTTANPEIGIKKEEQEIAKQLQALGARAIPHLLPLLADKNPAIRDLASYTLRDIEGLTEEHLDALMDSRRRGDGWIPLGIARIGTPRAIGFLVEELVRERETQTQVTIAIEQLGEKAVPFLVQVYERETDWPPELESTLHFVFHSLGEKAAAAVGPLMKIATDRAQPAAKRRSAIVALGAIGEPAAEAVSELQHSKESWALLRGDTTDDYELDQSVDDASIRVRTADAVPILTRRLAQSPDAHATTLILRDVARLQSRGTSAGPAVSRLLSDADWDVRVAAATTLGYIGYKEARHQLIALLERPEDWRLTRSAAEALGRLRSDEAGEKLALLSRGHWFPPVREAAFRALAELQQAEPSAVSDGGQALTFSFFDYEDAGAKLESLKESEAKALRFRVAATPRVVTAKVKTAGGANQTQKCMGLKLEDGHLVGTDNGEWGGEIRFIDRDGNSNLIAGVNTEGLYETAAGILAVTGLAHLDMNGGVIYKLSRSAAASWTAEKWRALPGAPRFSRLLENGDLLVSCYGGIVRVSPEGEMRLLTRGEAMR